MSTDPFELSRFLEAQADVVEGALRELQRGRKSGHWMWFIFPQLAGLGASPMARHYAIRSLDEARAYLAHPVLGPRLRECVHVLLAGDERSSMEIFGPVDALKFRSCLTLFARAAGEPSVFHDGLKAFCAGETDERTNRLLSENGD